MAYRGKLHFSWKEDEAIHGLGQGEEGIYDYRHHVQYMYQHNMRIPMPFLFSSRQYGILFDCGSLMTFNDDERGSYIYMDCVDQMNYYFVAGESADDVIDGYRFLTGKAVMLPRWAYGYVQSKEAYHTGDELEEIARHYRELGVPLDCVVQDWNTWDEGKWGQKTVDKKRYGHLKENIDRMHDMHVHTMVSMWPNMNPGGENHQQFFDAGYLLNDYSTYNAFDENARDMYWQQVSEELFPAGFDSWWCDSTEPFPSPDWGGAVMREPWERYALVGGEHKKYLDAGQANEFALYHAKGVYENQKKVDKKRRVLNLTRSGYAGSQKYGTVLWSGDIYASWKTLKKQIPEGLNMAMSGMPNWTLDVGAFFVVGSAWWKRGCNNSTNPNPIWFWKGEYNDGVEDPGYRELYVRWFEYGCFLPMFRSHGTDTPREIWNFGKKGDMAYDAIEKYSIIRAKMAIERSDVCVIIIDATEGFTEQDSKIAGLAHEAGKACIIAVNKWDAVEKNDKTMLKYKKILENDFSFMSYAPIIFISAKTGQRLDKLFEMIKIVSNSNSMRISTGTLNEILAQAVMRVQPPTDKGRRLKIYYMTQASTKPPTFVCFVNSAKLFHFSYQRYLENRIRETFGLEGTPVHFVIRERSDK